MLGRGGGRMKKSICRFLEERKIFFFFPTPPPMAPFPNAEKKKASRLKHSVEEV